jgi:hypothetical protein
MKSSPKGAAIVRPALANPVFTGTLNPVALDQPIFQRKTIRRSYDQIAHLTQELDAIKTSYNSLKKRLDEGLKAPKPTPFYHFKKWLFEFETRLREREFELSAFSKYIDSFRHKPNPTFVEVDASRVKRPRFDTVTVSLLVSNPQRYAFSTPDLKRQNHELEQLIKEQSSALDIVKARLALFAKFQHNRAAETVRACLEAGIVPKALGGEAPTQALELKTKRKMLSATLAELVAERRGLIAVKVKKRMKLRRHRLRMRMSVKIQSAARGFLVRIRMKQMKKAAVQIQRVYRGFRVRWHQKKAMDDMENFFDDGPSRKMRKVTKTRINPDGTEQEYYDYQYDDDGSVPSGRRSSGSSIVAVEAEDDMQVAVVDE